VAFTYDVSLTAARISLAECLFKIRCSIDGGGTFAALPA
jgi:hypothetical protein